MPPVGFKPAIPAGERLQTHALDRSATGIGNYQTHPGITVWHAIHRNTFLWPIFLEGGEKDEYLLLLNDALEHRDEIPPTVCWPYLQYDRAPPHFTGEVQNQLKYFQSDALSPQRQSNGHQNPWTSCLLVFPSGISQVIYIQYPPTHTPLTLKNISMLLLHTPPLRLQNMCDAECSIGSN
jgi:hypothetical protein